MLTREEQTTIYIQEWRNPSTGSTPMDVSLLRLYNTISMVKNQFLNMHLETSNFITNTFIFYFHIIS